MKNILRAACLAVPALLACTACAGQRLADDKVPQPVKNIFAKQHPKATAVKWEFENGKDYEAEFKDTGKQCSSTYDAKGYWIETETGIPISDLPEAVMKSIKTAHPEARVKEAERVEVPEGAPFYEVELVQGKEETELRYDAKGTLLRTEAEKEKSEDEEDND